MTEFIANQTLAPAPWRGIDLVLAWISPLSDPYLIRFSTFVSKAAADLGMMRFVNSLRYVLLCTIIAIADYLALLRAPRKVANP